MTIEQYINQYFTWLRGPIDHAGVTAKIVEEGNFTGRYAFMIVMASAIATLGLLLSSPAVIIGAMLISPLMGPIMKLGFSLSLLDLRATRQSLQALVLGTVLALAIAFLIVKLSPLTQVTPEILARTRPNLFDLLVAMFSGLAGGFAVVRSKGEAIVGVAIATALMPPLAVVGYGLASSSAAIAGGAFFLFMTNLIAIALCVTGITRFYGFGIKGGRVQIVWQSALTMLVFAALSAPLGVALSNIAWETSAIATARSVIRAAARNEGARLGEFNFELGNSGDIAITATLLGRSFHRDVETRLAESLAEALDRKVLLELDQVTVDRDSEMDAEVLLQRAEKTLYVPLQTQIAELRRSTRALQEVLTQEEQMRAAAAFPLAALEIDTEAQKATFVAAPSGSLSLAALRDIEDGLKLRFPDWALTVLPPAQSLPPLFFETGQTEMTAASRGDFEVILWALERWEVAEVVVTGYASSSGALRRFDNRELAWRRARAVSGVFELRGMDAEAIGEYQSFRQSQAELDLGMRNFQRVDVRIANQPAGANEFDNDVVQTTKGG